MIRRNGHCAQNKMTHGLSFLPMDDLCVVLGLYAFHRIAVQVIQVLAHPLAFPSAPPPRVGSFGVAIDAAKYIEGWTERCIVGPHARAGYG